MRNKMTAASVVGMETPNNNIWDIVEWGNEAGAEATAAVYLAIKKLEELLPENSVVVVGHGDEANGIQRNVVAQWVQNWDNDHGLDSEIPMVVETENEDEEKPCESCPCRNCPSSNCHCCDEHESDMDEDDDLCEDDDEENDINTNDIGELLKLILRRLDN